MPYIDRNRRKQVGFAMSHLIEQLKQMDNLSAGDLNYMITKIMEHFIKMKGKRYANYNELVGMLECCKMELYRREIAPYENAKMAENGDYNDDDLGYGE